ncbi:MAG: HNH endonuclease [Verrucomicrobiae bacterium]|nr:HNH endonuclease [Verrucomicrobiae bacterium]
MAVGKGIREAVRERASGLCEYCHASEEWQFVRFTIDHVIPQSKGGGDDLENLALSCRNCNERRGNRCEAADPQTGSEIAIFNPREDRWNDHFCWDESGELILPRSDKGRATIALLDLNDEFHHATCQKVRKRDVEDGYHPPACDAIVGHGGAPAVDGSRERAGE